MKYSNSNTPPEGTLGLLATGYKGIMLWREARQKAGINIVELKKKEYDIQLKESQSKKEEEKKDK